MTMKDHVVQFTCTNCENVFYTEHGGYSDTFTSGEHCKQCHCLKFGLIRREIVERSSVPEKTKVLKNRLYRAKP